MGLNEGHAWVSLGGVGYVELSEGFFGLTLMSPRKIIKVLRYIIAPTYTK